MPFLPLVPALVPATERGVQPPPHPVDPQPVPTVSRAAVIDAGAGADGGAGTDLALASVDSPANAPAVAPLTMPPETAAEPAAPAADRRPTAPPADLDELARKLYDRIRTRLKAELRLDRERAGLLTDLPR
jgi:hypothetical protein